MFSYIFSLSFMFSYIFSLIFMFSYLSNISLSALAAAFSFLPYLSIGQSLSTHLFIISVNLHIFHFLYLFISLSSSLFLGSFFLVLFIFSSINCVLSFCFFFFLRLSFCFYLQIFFFHLFLCFFYIFLIFIYSRLVCLSLYSVTLDESFYRIPQTAQMYLVIFKFLQFTLVISHCSILSVVDLYIHLK